MSEAEALPEGGGNVELSDEPISTEFMVLVEKPLKIQCIYCERIYKLEEIVFTSKEKKEKKVKQRILL